MVFMFLVSSPGLWAQTTAANAATEFDTTEFPQWARDLRRGEIVTFGSFPILYIFSNAFFNNAPLSFNFATSKDKTFMILGVAAGASFIVALADHGIMRYKRNRLAKESRNLPEGTIIITRTPLDGEEPENSSPESTKTGNP